LPKIPSISWYKTYGSVVTSCEELAVNTIISMFVLALLCGCGRDEAGGFKKVCVYGISYFRSVDYEAAELKDDGTNVGCN